MRLPLAAFAAVAALASVPSSAAGAPAIEVLRSDFSVLELAFSQERPALVEVSEGERTWRRPEVEGAHHVADPGRPDLPVLIRLVAIPAEGPLPRVSVTSVDARPLPVDDLAPAPAPRTRTENGAPLAYQTRVGLELAAGPSPGRWAEILGTSWVRGQRVARLALHPCRWDGRRLEWARSLGVRLEFPEAPASRAPGARADAPDFERALGGFLLNADVARTWRRGRGGGVAPRSGGADSFDSSPNWIRFPIRDAGVYRLDYFTFANHGVDPAGVDPRTIRVFAGRNLPLEEDLAAAPPAAFMEECALKDLGDGDTVFDLEDRLFFYALGPHGWANEYDPARSRTEWVENAYGDVTYYWVTWGGSFSGPPRRTAQRSVPDTTATEWPATAPHRLHFERNNTESFRFRDEDGWMWEDLRGRGTDRLYTLDVSRPASGDGILTARLCSHEAAGIPLRSVDLKLAGQVVTHWEWFHGPQTAVEDVTGCFEGRLVAGPNSLRVNANADPAAIDHMYTAWFDLEYDRRLVARSGSFLKFFASPDPPPLPAPPPGSDACTIPASLADRYGGSAWRLLGFDAPASEILLFDVTDPHAPVELVDFRLQNAAPPHDLRFSDPGQPGVRWYVAVTTSGVLPLPAGEIPSIRGLRRPANGAEYVVIHHETLREGAERLAALRRDLSWRPRSTMTIDVEEIYTEFAWGMRDPVAIRDFLAWAFGNWEGDAPLFVALLGDAAYDTKGYLSGSPPDLISTYTARYRENNVEYEGGDNIDFYSTDDFFAYLEAADWDGSAQPGVDLAIGRWPVASSAVLDAQLDKLESYLRYEMPGQWQNRVILVADDERTLSESQREPFHTIQVETLASERYPPALDRVKVYLVDFPRNEFGKKPTAQAKYIEEFTRGALMTTYTGHGDQNTMAQEEVFVSQKIPELLNEKRYTVFSTFSCTVSRFDLLSGNSMAELLLAHEGGGAVTTFASGGLVFPGPSATLNQEWLGAVFGTPYLIPTFARTPEPLGIGALMAKIVTAVNSGVRKNNEKYVLLGDPALEVRFGRQLVTFEDATIDSLATDGLVRVVQGAVVDAEGRVLDGTNGTTPFRGTGWVRVTENADSSGYDYTLANGAEQHIDFVLEGATAFRGQVPIVDGRFEARFHLSEGVLPGNSGRISVFGLESGGLARDASGASDRLVVAPTISPSQVEDGTGPRIVIRFEGYEDFIDGDLLFTDRPVMAIELEDPHGINLRPFPQFARLEAEVDGRDRIDLAEDFSYDEGSFTRGRVRRILPLSPGEHTLQVKAFDNVGNRSTGSLRFSIVLPGGDFDLVDRYTAVYPNPSRGRADFLFRLTHDAEVDLQVFTITGRRIWQKTAEPASAGDNVIGWDGRDDGGAPLANGTYLYKLKARTVDEEGNAVSDELVGKLVIMR